MQGAWQSHYQLWHAKGLMLTNHLECIKYRKLTYLKNLYYKKKLKKLYIKTEQISLIWKLDKFGMNMGGSETNGDSLA